MATKTTAAAAPDLIYLGPDLIIARAPVSQDDVRRLVGMTNCPDPSAPFDFSGPDGRQGAIDYCERLTERLSEPCGECGGVRQEMQHSDIDESGGHHDHCVLCGVATDDIPPEEADGDYCPGPGCPACDGKGRRLRLAECQWCDHKWLGDGTEDGCPGCGKKFGAVSAIDLGAVATLRPATESERQRWMQWAAGPCEGCGGYEIGRDSADCRTCKAHPGTRGPVPAERVCPGCEEYPGDGCDDCGNTGKVPGSPGLLVVAEVG